MRRTGFLVGVLVLAFLSGCAQFKSRKRMDLGPFAEDLIAVAGDIQYGLGQQQFVTLYEYLDVPEVADLQMLAGKVRSIVRGTITYSIQIVTLADSRMSGPERAGALADQIDVLLRPVLAAPAPELLMTVAELDTILAEVRSRRDLLEAIEAAQPIVDEIARASGTVFDQTKVAIDNLVHATWVRIQAEYAPILQTDKALRDAQLRTVSHVGYLVEYRRGNAAALDSLVAGEPSLVAEVAGRGVAEQDLRAIEERLLFKLRALSELREQIEPDLRMMHEKNRELGQFRASTNAALRQGRVAILAWSRAHDRLGQGITDPAKINVLGIARKAAGSFTPL